MATDGNSITGLIEWFKGLFGAKKQSPDEAAAAAATSAVLAARVAALNGRPEAKPVVVASAPRPPAPAPAPSPAPEPEPEPALEIDPVPEPVDELDTPASVLADADPIGALIAAVSGGAGFVFLPAPLGEDEGAAAVQPVTSEIQIDGDGRSFLRLSEGSATATAGGKTGGYSIRVPDEFETAASGARIKIGVVARSAGEPAKFAIAYSTNEVGNSGWRWFDVTAEWAAFEMEYAVPVMKQGLGDFISLLPRPAGEPGIELYVAAATVI